MKPRRSINSSMVLPTPPNWFNEGQVKIYRELGAKVLDLKVWAQSDYDAFCILVDNLYGYQQASSIIADEGVLTRGRHGEWVRHPATIARNACWTNIQPLLIAFGLTPSARAQMGLSPDEDNDPIGDFLQGTASGVESTKHH